MPFGIDIPGSAEDAAKAAADHFSGGTSQAPQPSSGSARLPDPGQPQAQSPWATPFGQGMTAEQLRMYAAYMASRKGLPYDVVSYRAFVAAHPGGAPVASSPTPWDPTQQSTSDPSYTPSGATYDPSRGVVSMPPQSGNALGSMSFGKVLVLGALAYLGYKALA